MHCSPFIPAQRAITFIPLTLSILFLACACLPEAGIEEVWTSVSMAPVFEEAKAVDSCTVELRFSKPVQIVAVHADGELGPPVVQEEEPGEVKLIVFSEDLKAGVRYTLEVDTRDASGNRLSVITPVTGRNDRIPKLRLNEIRTEYSKPKSEFVELYALEDGNLGGIGLFTSGSGTQEPLFSFPPCEVTAGEYILVHMRCLDENALNECASIDECISGEAVASARDFWVEGTIKRIRKNDFIAVCDQDGRILDAVLLCDYTGVNWKTAILEEGSAWLLGNAGWLGMNGVLCPDDAAPSGAATTTRTINRQENSPDSDSKGDWYITVTSGATPGAPNNSVRYEAP